SKGIEDGKDGEEGDQDTGVFSVAGEAGLELHLVFVLVHDLCVDFLVIAAHGGDLIGVCPERAYRGGAHFRIAAFHPGNQRVFAHLAPVGGGDVGGGRG